MRAWTHIKIYFPSLQSNCKTTSSKSSMGQSDNSPSYKTSIKLDKIVKKKKKKNFMGLKNDWRRQQTEDFPLEKVLLYQVKRWWVCGILAWRCPHLCHTGRQQNLQEMVNSSLELAVKTYNSTAGNRELNSGQLGIQWRDPRSQHINSPHVHDCLWTYAGPDSLAKMGKLRETGEPARTLNAFLNLHTAQAGRRKPYSLQVSGA